MSDNFDTYQKLVNEDFPIVFMDRMVPELAIPSILLDNEMAVNLAMDHFVAKGYERIGIITTSIIHHVTPRVERTMAINRGLDKAWLANESSVHQEFGFKQHPKWVKGYAGLGASSSSHPCR